MSIAFSCLAAFHRDVTDPVENYPYRFIFFISVGVIGFLIALFVYIVFVFKFEGRILTVRNWNLYVSIPAYLLYLCSALCMGNEFPHGVSDPLHIIIHVIIPVIIKSYFRMIIRMGSLTPGAFLWEDPDQDLYNHTCNHSCNHKIILQNDYTNGVTNSGCVPLGRSGSGLVIQDHSDHGVPKKRGF